MRAAILLNLASGDNAPSQATLQRVFSQHGVRARVVTVTRRTFGRGLAEAVAGAPEVLVAAGGDGTANAVANAAIRHGTDFGIVPTGSLNHFARDAGLPEEVEAAVRAIASGAVAQVDVADLNGRFFLNNSSIGLYPRLVHHREELRDRRGHGKVAATAQAALRLWARDQTMTVAVQTQRRLVRRRTPFVFVGNNPYQMRFFDIGRRTSLDTGQLCVYLSRHAGRAAAVRLAVGSLLGSLKQSEDFEALASASVTLLATRERMRVAVDGEVHRVALPLRYRIHPRRLRLRVPRRRAP